MRERAAAVGPRAQSKERPRRAPISSSDMRRRRLPVRTLMAFRIVAGSTLRVSTAGAAWRAGRGRSEAVNRRAGSVRGRRGARVTHRRRAARPPCRAARCLRRWLRRSRWPGEAARRHVASVSLGGFLATAASRRGVQAAGRRAKPPGNGALGAGAGARTSTRQTSNAASPRRRRLAEGASLAAVTARGKAPDSQRRARTGGSEPLHARATAERRPCARGTACLHRTLLPTAPPATPARCRPAASRSAPAAPAGSGRRVSGRPMRRTRTAAAGSTQRSKPGLRRCGTRAAPMPLR